MEAAGYKTSRQEIIVRSAKLYFPIDNIQGPSSICFRTSNFAWHSAINLITELLLDSVERSINILKYNLNRFSEK